MRLFLFGEIIIVIGKSHLINRNLLHEHMLYKFPKLESESLILREIKLSDAEAIYRIFSDPRVLKYHDLEEFKNIEEAKCLIYSLSEGFREQEVIRWGIAKKRENIIIGTCGYSGWNKNRLRAEIGYELSQAHWRQGIMTKALSAVINYGFEIMQLNRIEATVMLPNIASIKLLHKLGFQEEGILRERGFWKGHFHDLKMFALLKKDYVSSW